MVNSAWLTEDAPLAARVRTVSGEEVMPEETDIPVEFRDYDKVFSEKDASLLPNQELVNHEILL